MRIVDRVNARQMGWVVCPTAGCAGGRIVQPQEKSAFYSCFLCEQEGCIRCGNEHQGACSQYAQQMKEFENLLRLGAEEPPAIRLSNDDLRGRFRPCYHCGVITERSDGCNAMTCSRCHNDWDWNKGSPSGHGHVRDKMRYKPLRDPHF